MTWLVLDRSGSVLFSSESLDDAQGFAEALGPWVNLATPGPVANPARRMDPYTALALTGLPQDLPRQAVLDLTPHQAYAQVESILEETVEASNKLDLEAGKEPRDRGFLALDQLTRPGSGLLGENAKLHKRDPRHPSGMALGLSLVPEFSAFGGQLDRHGRSGETAGGVPLGLQPVAGDPASTLCASSSEECRRSCLIYSGQNQSDPHNNLVKLARAKMLLEHPEAFMRLLLHAMDKYHQAHGSDFGSGTPIAKFIRLNVFSDIPWELFVPWLFEDRRFEFYDYTKVPGRGYPDNYDLSFSYSGVNMPECQEEFESGRRIVIVFGSERDYKHQSSFKGLGDTRAAQTRAHNVLPDWIRDPAFAGGRRIKVLDGDVSDLRPWDEPHRVGHGRYGTSCCVVGLRWKYPQLESRLVKELPGHFVIEGEVVPETDRHKRYFKLPVTPASTRIGP